MAVAKTSRCDQSFISLNLNFVFQKRPSLLRVDPKELMTSYLVPFSVFSEIQTPILELWAECFTAVRPGPML